MSTSLVLGNATIKSPIVVSPFIELISIEKTGRLGRVIMGDAVWTGVDGLGMVRDRVGVLRACFEDGRPSAELVVRLDFLEVLFAFPFFSLLVFGWVVFMKFSRLITVLPLVSRGP